MAGIGLGPFLEAIGAGIGQGVEQINRQKQQQQQLELQKMAALRDNLMLQQFLRKQQQDQAFGALSPDIGTPGGGAGAPAGGVASGLPGSPYVASGPMLGAGVPQTAMPRPDYGSTPPEGMLPQTPAMASGGGGNWETQHNNFAGMRIPGVVAGPNAGGFQSFATPEAGVQGIAHQLDRYASGATTGKPLTTLRQIVSTWAPPSENPTDQLIARASQVVGVSPDQPLDLGNPQVKAKLVEAMIRGEQGGRLPIDPAVIQRGLSGGGAPQQMPGLPGAPNQLAQASPQQTGDTMTDAGPQGAPGGQGAMPQLPPPPQLYDVRQVQQHLVQQVQSAGLPPGDPRAQAFVAKGVAQATAENNALVKRWEMQKAIAEFAMRSQAAQRSAAAQEALSRSRGLRFERLPDGTVKEWHPGEPIVPGATITAEAPAPGGGKAAAFGSKEDLMNRWHQDFVSQNKREPTTDEISAERVTIGQSTKPPGRQLAQMTQRLMIGANEVNKAVTAISQLPPGTTLGIFGGAQAAMGEGLGENIRKALANEVTPEASQVLKALSNGVSRGLAILESGGSAQGLVGLSKQLQNDLPQAGDTGLTIAAKFADIRQIVEAATEVLSANPDLSKEQKALLSNIGADVQKAVPFTTSEVAKVAGNPTDESLAAFARKLGVGGPPPEAVQEMQAHKDDPVYRQSFEKHFGKDALTKALGQ